MVKRVGILLVIMFALLCNIARASDRQKVVVRFDGVTNFHGHKYLVLTPVLPVQFGVWTKGPLLNTPNSIQVCEVYDDVVKLGKDDNGQETEVTATFLDCPDNKHYRLDILLFPKDGK